MKKHYKIIFLDRDGVINEDSPNYIKSPDEWRAIPGSLEAIAQLNQQGFKVVIISNQSGIGRGYFSYATLETIHHKMQQELAKLNGHIDAILFCPHHPDENCQCRKPKPKILLDALAKFNLTANDALFVGDAWTDVLLAKNAGCDAVLVKTGKGEKTILEHKNDLKNIPILNNLSEISQFFSN